MCNLPYRPANVQIDNINQPQRELSAPEGEYNIPEELFKTQITENKHEDNKE